MINAEFLSRCSDDAIERGVAWCNVTNKNISMIHTPDSAFDNLWCNAVLSKIRPFCSNPNDIMPIAFANELFAIPCIDGGYMASDGVYDTEIEEIIGECNWAHSTNPLRAICEVYILMSVNK